MWVAHLAGGWAVNILLFGGYCCPVGSVHGDWNG